ncbi:YceI family protein [Marinoscillum sp. MHG1-6]|uniref:YceI family protein n=1 Tax=Marinoscillum sp. MHG1-6 TaxID=2959627 RepID=UPI0021580E8C|nr:YceI family protein [Marinoscillum sp. MHG1-6]
MKIYLKTGLVILVLCIATSLQAQKYVSEKSNVTFYSYAPLEDITAKSKKAVGIIDVDAEKIAFSIPIRSFDFEKSLMQEHFNEKYMESDKYPKSTFQAVLIDFNARKKGVQNVTAKGKLTIHGITQNVEIPGKIEMLGNGKIQITSTFMVKLVDYDITVPQIVFQNIAEEIEVKVDFTLSKKK